MNNTVPITALHLQSWYKKSKGLIGAKRIYPVFFTTRWGIHTFGVRSPIDVIILDDSWRVVKFVQNLAPYSFFFWNPTYERVIELPGGTIQSKKTIHVDTRIRLSTTN